MSITRWIQLVIPTIKHKDNPVDLGYRFLQLQKYTKLKIVGLLLENKVIWIMRSAIMKQIFWYFGAHYVNATFSICQIKFENW